MTSTRFVDAVAIVTGAASGIGRSTAIGMAREGARVVCLDIADASATVQAIVTAGGEAVALQGDVSDAATAGRAVQVANQRFGTVSVLANVAGVPDIAQGAGLDAVSTEQWNRVLAVNLTGPFLMAKAVLPGMVAAGRGAIVNVSSTAGRLYSINATPAYSSSKAGLLGLTRHLASDYGKYGIRVNAICPGAVDTPMMKASIDAPAADDPAAMRRRERSAAAQAMTALGRISSPEEQAAAILFLASADAAFITGVSLDTNGGFYMI